MNTEEKAKRYDEAIERAKGVIEQNPLMEYLKKGIEYILPELKESEDEKIRKVLINGFNKFDKSYIWYNGITIGQILAWLEKQGENPTTLPKWKYKNDNTPLLRDSLILNKYGCVAKSPSGAIVSDVWVIDYNELAKLPKEEFEKQGEQEKLNTYIDKLASDTIYNDENGNPIDKDLMAFASKVAFSMIPVTKTESYHHLNRGRISDAVIKGAQWQKKKSEQKAVIVPKFRIGDTVRAKTMKNFVFTIKDIIDKQYVDTNDGKYDIEEQGNWELVEQKPTWSEEDEKIIETMCKEGDLKPSEVQWLKSLKERVQPQPKQEWSKEDNIILSRIIADYERSNEEWFNAQNSLPHGRKIAWLKSLRPQSHWKPSYEQMEYLAKAIVTLGDKGNCKTASILNDLRLELKKLREE